MKIAVITDVHANLPALQAALESIEREGVDAIYHTGDAIGIGPYPAETLDLLLNTPNMRFVMGNHDALFAAGLPEERPKWMSAGEYAHQHWVHAQLTPAQHAVVSQWTYILEEQLAGLPVTFLHYALAESGKDFLPIVKSRTKEEFDRVYSQHANSQHAPSLIFYGHHHPQADISGQTRYVNPGSLGVYTRPFARYVLLEIAPDGSYTLEQREVPYNLDTVLKTFDQREVPDRDFIRRVLFTER